MLWNSGLPWESPDFQFVELFAGRGNASREWLVTQFVFVDFMHVLK